MTTRTKQHIAIGIAILVGLGAFAAAFISGGADNVDVSVQNNPALEALIPRRGSETVPQQSNVGVDFAPGFTGGNLVIKGTVIPDAELTRIDPLGQVFFTPDGSRVLSQLPADLVCAEMTYWPIAEPDETALINWCFDVS
ncbi:MAG: hypothetical protein HKN26_05115 [Acidimicrobiales bacterium]|nr:hypothetical protein [Acidimicrobiales bacterium]